MRADMFKIIVERPRWASRHAPAVKLKKDTNFDRKFVGHKRHALEVAPYTKSLNENLAPLKRYLQKQRGRRWDDVFSEICKHLDTTSTVKMHVREHIEDFIVVRISVDRNGRWLGQQKWSGAQPIHPIRWMASSKRRALFVRNLDCQNGDPLPAYLALIRKDRLAISSGSLRHAV